MKGVFMSKKVKLIGGILLVVFVLMNFAQPVIANENTDQTSGKCGKKVAWNLDANGVLTISGTGKMYDIKSKELWNRDNVKKIMIKAGVTSVGKYAFSNSKNLELVIMSDTINSIGDSAFRGCEKLRKITLSKSLAKIGDLAFAECENLNSVKIPDKVTRIEGMTFYKCKSLKTVSLSKRTNYLGNRAFYCCESLTQITIPEGVSEIPAKAFAKCQKLRKVELSKNITKIRGKAFLGCSSLKQLKLPELLNTIEKEAFSEAGLTEVNIPRNVKKIGTNAFGSNQLRKITVSEKNKKYDSRKNCNAIILTANNNLIVGCGNTKIPGNVKKIGKCAFYNCKNLRKIIIPKSVREIEQYAFGYCKALTEVRFGNTVVTVDGSSFEKDILVKKVYVHGDIKKNEYGYGDYSIPTGKDTTVFCKDNTNVKKYAKARKIKCIIVKKS